MFYQGQTNTSCGCNQGCQIADPTYQKCNQVVQTCNVQDVPHYTNYHTHLVNNCIKRHISVPTYSASQETVLQDQYVDGAPMYGYPAQMPNAGLGMYPNMTNTNMGCGCGNSGMMYANQQMPSNQNQMMYGNPMGQYSPMQYQGNVGTEPAMMQQPMMYQGINMPYNY